MNIFDEAVQRVEDKRAQQQAQDRQRAQLVEVVESILTRHERERALELAKAAESLAEQLSSSKVLSGRKNAQGIAHGEKVVLTVGTKQLMIEVRYPPSDQTYFKRVSALSKHLLEPVRCSLVGSWRAAR